MIEFWIIALLIPLCALAPGLSVRPIPLRVDGAEPKLRFAQHCRRIAFFLMGIPVMVTCLIVGLFIYRFSGGEGLLAVRKSLWVAGGLWKLSSIVGMLCGLAACIDSNRRNDGYKFIATYAALLFIGYLFSQLQYAGHPD